MASKVANMFSEKVWGAKWELWHLHLVTGKRGNILFRGFSFFSLRCYDGSTSTVVVQKCFHFPTNTVEPKKQERENECGVYNLLQKAKWN